VLAASVVRDALAIAGSGQKAGGRDRAALLDTSGRKALDLKPGANDKRSAG
jgi:hypothetical protein